MDQKLDSLTGLLNAAAFLEQLEQRTRQGETLVLVVMDLDRFLLFNETYGHQAGDEWIRACGGRFAQVFGKDSLPTRYGSDEFMAAVREHDLFKVYQQAEALRQSIVSDAPTLQVEGESIRPKFTISLGLAAFPANAGDMIDLIEKSKGALRRAKIAGGNQVTFYQETDTLTGLLNFCASQRALHNALELARQNKQPLSVFLLDIDRFKEINDTHGHRAGDEVLKRLGRILEANFKEAGSIGRISGHDGGGGQDAGGTNDAESAGHAIARVAGDEFLVILAGQRADSTFILAEEVRRLVDDSPIKLRLNERDYELRFTISGGIATFPGDANDPIDLLRKAGEALYRSKHTGRNRISLPTAAQMVTKTSYYTQIQLERLAALARKLDKTEAFLLREALDDLLRRYDEESV